VLNGKGASLLDGYMEDLATDRIYRLMIAQRMRHGGVMDESGKEIPHTAQFIHRLFDEELEKLISDSSRKDEGSDENLREARRIAESMVMNEEFDPI
jgi:malate synthase